MLLLANTNLFYKFTRLDLESSKQMVIKEDLRNIIDYHSLPIVN